MSAGINKITNDSVASQNQIASQKVPSKNKIEETAKISSDPKNAKNDPKVQMPSPKELKRVIDKINENVSRLNKDVRFYYNDAIKSLVVKVINAKTGQVIREIPPKEVINLQKKISEIVGIIFDSKEVEK